MIQPNFKTAPFEKVFEWVKSQKEMPIVVEGIDFSLNDKHLEMKIGDNNQFKFFWWDFDNSKGRVTMLSNHNLEEFNGMVQAYKHIAKVLGFDLSKGKDLEIAETPAEPLAPVIEGYSDEDVEQFTKVSNLEGQIEVYKSLVPKFPSGEITFKN